MRHACRTALFFALKISIIKPEAQTHNSILEISPYHIDLQPLFISIMTYKSATILLNGSFVDNTDHHLNALLRRNRSRESGSVILEQFYHFSNAFKFFFGICSAYQLVVSPANSLDFIPGLKTAEISRKQWREEKEGDLQFLPSFVATNPGLIPKNKIPSLPPYVI
jgi:hypothetical protein